MWAVVTLPTFFLADANLTLDEEGILHKSNVDGIEKAYVYVLDCQLATVEHQAIKKRRSKGEFNRQINIAQTMLDWAIAYNLPLATTRAKHIVDTYGSRVQAWADKLIAEN